MNVKLLNLNVKLQTSMAFVKTGEIDFPAPLHIIGTHFFSSVPLR